MTPTFTRIDTELPLPEDNQMLFEKAEMDTNNGGNLVITIRVFGSETRISMRFSDPVGLSYFDELFGSNAGQITRDDRTRSAGWFSRSDNSDTLAHIKSVCGKAFASEAENKSHYRLSLMNTHFDFVANKAYRVEVIEDLDKTMTEKITVKTRDPATEAYYIETDQGAAMLPECLIPTLRPGTRPSHQEAYEWIAANSRPLARAVADLARGQTPRRPFDIMTCAPSSSL